MGMKPYQREGWENEMEYEKAIEKSLKSDLFFWLRQPAEAPDRDKAIAKCKHALRRMGDGKRYGNM